MDYTQRGCPVQSPHGQLQPSAVRSLRGVPQTRPTEAGSAQGPFLIIHPRLRAPPTTPPVLGYPTDDGTASLAASGADRRWFLQSLRRRDRRERSVASLPTGRAKCLLVLFAARQVQTRRGDTGPLSPDHLREAYRMYQEETGRVGAARPLRGKRLFVR